VQTLQTLQPTDIATLYKHYSSTGITMQSTIIRNKKTRDETICFRNLHMSVYDRIH